MFPCGHNISGKTAFFILLFNMMKEVFKGAHNSEMIAPQYLSVARNNLKT